MEILVTGGTGFVGTRLLGLLTNEGHSVTVLTRGQSKTEDGVRYVQWLQPHAHPERELVPPDAVVNLAGVSINDGNWSEAHQQKIYSSRMEATDELLRILKKLPEKPDVFVNASAVGIYPTSEFHVYTDESPEIAHDFLGKTVHDWEQKASEMKDFGSRVVFTRFGTVFGNGGGALPLIALPYKLFAGGPIGSGRQWISWVHAEDAARAILFAISSSSLEGPVNVTAPAPVRMSELGRTIASLLHRPHWLPVPGFAMKALLGQKSKLVLEGQHVLPEKLMGSGFTFRYPAIRPALADALDIRDV
ncbi:epimerase family protein YfhF [Sporosarcina sp. NCCP-2716]|uniref:TIGR01777 family oxidoreductase n=1 Tax=Sporosarcina sp. NCCP-2716 TaxID=2943679 RepID=UPI00203D1999|nr:TIGR01777 family oxidoreductase [Sporosarcina sp. NCCP-2716]GKV69639.1 epimerase family protein YfhF [Sporosarcina sp. NCCP-2716]